MLYTGQFRSLHRNKLYTVQIQTGNSATPAAGELTLGPEPFVTQMDGDADTIYSPVKYSSATIQIVNDEYLFSLYSSTAKQNTVKLLDASNNILFYGYTSPNTWDSEYNFEIETYDIEALDCLSILQYYDYKLLGQQKNFVNFRSIIDSILNTVGVTEWYWSTNTTINGVSGNLPNLMTISESCFFDEDEEPMKLNEVLEEICKFCGVTAIAQGRTVYFIDYDAINHGYNSYLHYNIGTGNPTGTVTLSDSHSITSDDYSKTGSSLTLKGTYSKATVRDSLYAVESIMPEMFNEEDLENVAYQDENNQNWGYEYEYLDSSNEPIKIQKKYFNIRLRSYRNKKYNHLYYSQGLNPIDASIFDGYTSQSIVGAGFMQYNVSTGDTDKEANENMKFDDWENYLMISRNFHSVSYHNILVLEPKEEFIKPFFLSTKARFLIKGTLIMSDMTKAKYKENHKTTINVPYFPTTDIDSEASYHKGYDEMSIAPKDINMTLKVSVGGYYASDENTWSTDSSNTIKVPFCLKKLRYSTDAKDTLFEGKENLLSQAKHEIFFRNHNVTNNILYSDKISSEGFVIGLEDSIGEGVVIAAKPKVSVYVPDNIIAYDLGAAFIKDFDVQMVVPYQGGRDDNDTDTEYSYTINDDYINELSPIEFKICTYDGKQLNYSAVAYSSNGNYKFVDELNNHALNLIERSENQMCYRIVNQYSEPVKVLKLNLFDDYKPYSLLTESLLGIDCIVDCMNHDYVTDSVEITLVEKK